MLGDPTKPDNGSQVQVAEISTRPAEDGISQF